MFEGRITRLPEGWEAPQLDDSGTIHYLIFRRIWRSALAQLTAALEAPMQLQNNCLENLIKIERERARGGGAAHARIQGLEEYRREVPLVQHSDFSGAEDLNPLAPFVAVVDVSESKRIALTRAQIQDIAVVQRLLKLSWLAEVEGFQQEVQCAVFGSGRWSGGRFIGGAAALGHMQRSWPLRAADVAPMWVASIHDYELRAYCILRYALQTRPDRLLTGSASTPLSLARFFGQWREDLAGDLSDGTLNRGPARGLTQRRRTQAAWTLRRGALSDTEAFCDRLPLTTVCAPKGGATQFMRDRCEHLFGRSPHWLDRGLHVNAIPITLPLHSSWQGGLVWPGGTVLEFIPIEGGDAVWLHELEQGRVYRIVMGMVCGGLIRLDTGELVGVAGAVEGLPLLIHLGHADQVLPAYGERVHPAHVAAALTTLPIRGIRGFVAASVGPGRRFHVGIEGLGAATYEGRLERGLQDVHSGYRELRIQGRIGGLEISYLPGGTLGRFENHRLRIGGVWGELSERHIVDELTLARLCDGWPD